MELFQFDEDYLVRLKAGDTGVEQHFVSYFGKLLRIKLRARRLAPHVVDDLSQETFIRVLLALKREGAIHSPERLGSFVNSVCNNVLLEHYRGGIREQSLDETQEPEDPKIDLDRVLVSEEAKVTVRKILASLPARDRLVLHALFLEEKPKDEVCQELGIDREYLRVLVHRAKQQFRSHLTR